MGYIIAYKEKKNKYFCFIT